VYSRLLRKNIILDIVSIIMFSAIDLIYHLGISESFFPIFFACALIILLWILISIWFKDEDEKWKRRWRIPVWQILLWVSFFAAGLLVVFRYPDSWFANGGGVVGFLLISDLCRNIWRCRIAERFGFDDFDSVEDLLSEHPEAGKYLH